MSILDSARKAAEEEKAKRNHENKIKADTLKSTIKSETPILDSARKAVEKKAKREDRYPPKAISTMNSPKTVNTKTTQNPGILGTMGDIAKSFGAAIGYELESTGAGALSAVDNMGDFAVNLLRECAKIATWGEGDNFIDGIADRITKDSLGEAWQNNADERYGRYIPEWIKKYNPASIAGGMAPSIAAEAYSLGAAPTELDFLGMSVLQKIFSRIKPSDVAQFLSSAGSASKSAYDETGDMGKSLQYGFSVAPFDVATEKLFGGLGGTGIGADELIDLGKVKALNKISSTKGGKIALDYLGEIAEEEIMAFIEPAMKKAVVNSEAEFPGVKELGETAIQTILATAFLKSATYPINKHTRKQAVQTLNNSISLINETMEDDIVLEPLRDNANETEIAEKQKEIKALYNRYTKTLEAKSELRTQEPLEEAARYVVENSKPRTAENPLEESHTQKNDISQALSTDVSSETPLESVMPTNKSNPNLHHESRAALASGTTTEELYNRGVSDSVLYRSEGIEETISEAETKSEKAAFDAGRLNVPRKEVTLLTPEQEEAYEQGRREYIKNIPAENANIKQSESDPLFIDNRTNETVTSRTVNAFQYDNPDVKPFYKAIAEELKDDLTHTVKGERIAIRDVNGDFVRYVGIPRQTSESIAYIKNSLDISYGDIEKALDRIIHDEGQENTVLAKKIELVIDEMLTKGYKTFEGYDIPPNTEYVEIKNGIGGIESTHAEEVGFFDEWEEDLPFETVADKREKEYARETSAKKTVESEVKSKPTENEASNDAATDTTNRLIYTVSKVKKTSTDIYSKDTEKVFREIIPEYKKFVKGLRRFARGLDVKIKIFDGEKLGTGEIDGFYDKGSRTMYLNYKKPQKPIQATVRHEVIHVFKQMNLKGYNAFADFVVEKYKGKYGEDAYNTWIENKMTEYAEMGIELDEKGAIEELCAEIGMDMMQNKTDVNALVAKDKTAAQKLGDAFRKIKNAVYRAFGLPENITIEDAMKELASLGETVSTTDGKVDRRHTPYGYDNLPGALGIAELNRAQELLMEGIAEFEKAQRQVWNRDGKELKALAPKKRVQVVRKRAAEILGTKAENNADIRFSLGDNTAEDVEYVLNNKNYTEDVYLTKNTPSIISSQKGVKNLPMLMKASHIRENVLTEQEAIKKGLRVNKNINYHGLGKELFLKIIGGLDEVTLAYRGTKNADNPSRRENYFLLISQYKDAEGNTVNVPVYINETAQYNRVFIDSNKIATVFGRNNFTEYINREIKKGNLIRIKNKDIQASELASPINASYNENVSNDNISQTETVVNDSIGEKSKKTTAFSDVTETQQFKRWFGDSKIVDKDGKPKVMYHGSSEKFTVFDIKKAKRSGHYGKGFYFSDSKSHANTYGNSYEVYLSIKHPLSPNNDTVTKKQIENFLTAVAENSDDYSIENYGTYDIAEIMRTIESRDAFSVIMDVNTTAIGDMVEAVKLFNEVNGTNFDGISVPTETVAFYPTQIKSATDNIGTFDGDNADIRFSATIPKGEKPARDIDVPERDKKGGKVSRGVRTVLEAKATPDSYVTPIMEDIEKGKYSHDVITDEVAQESAFKRISREERGADGRTERVLDGEKYKRVLNETLERFEEGGLDGKNDVALLQALYTNAANSYDYLNQVDENGVPLAEKLVIAMVQTASKAGQTLQASRLLKKTTPAGKLYDLEMFVKNINREIRNQWGKWVDNENAQIEKQWGKIKDGKRDYKTDAASKKRRRESRRHGRAYTKYQKDIVLDKKLVEQLMQANNQQEANAIEEKIINDIAGQIKSTVGDQIHAFRYTAMLFNPRTHIRNIVGNTAFSGIVSTRNVIDAALQAAIIKDKSRRTKTIAFTKEQRAEQKKLVDYADRLFKEQFGYIRGESGKYDTFNNKIDENRKIFGWKPLEGVRQFNSNLLESEDVWFIRRHFRSHFANALLAKGVTLSDVENGTVSRKVIEETMKYASEQAQKATFRDASDVAKALNNLEKINPAAELIAGGVVPFKKTPLNILKRGIEYSPLSIVKAVGRCLQEISAVKNGHLDSVDAADILENFSEGLTGSAIAAIGFFLFKAGILAITAGDDEEEENLGEAMGKQSYALEFGDYSFTIDWAAPAVMPLFMGAEIAKTLEDKEDISGIRTVARMANPLIETSMLSGVLGTLESIRYSESDGDVLKDLTTDIMSGYLMQYVPSLSGTIARVFDSVESRTSRPSHPGDEGFLEMLGRKIGNKVPILRNIVNSKPYIDIMGKYEKKKDAGDYLMSALQNFILPGYISKVASTNAVKELKAVLLEVERTDFIPQFVKSIGTHKLTHDEYFDYHQERGELYDEVIPYLTEQGWYKNCTANQKAEILKEFKDAADRLTKKSFVPGYNINNTKLDAIFNADEEKRGENVVDIYLYDKYLGFNNEATEEGKPKYEGIDPNVVAEYLKGVNTKNIDGKVEKSEIIDVITEMNISNDTAWDLYFSEYDSKAAMEAKAFGIDAKLFMKATMHMSSIKADYKNGKVIRGSRRDKIERYLRSICGNYKEYLFLLGTEYDSTTNDTDYISYFGKG